MPPGNVLPKPPLPIIERSTAEACLAIAHRVQLTQRLSGDASGSEAARQIAEGIQRELLRTYPPRPARSKG